MTTVDFGPVVAEWVYGSLPKIIKRDLNLPLTPSSVVSVTGARRAGKTFLLFHTIAKLLENGVPRENILYLDFEHPRLGSLKVEDLDEMLKVFYEISRPKPDSTIHFFLDEIQNVKEYGKWFRRRLNAKYYISGSTSKISSKGIAEEMRGRSVDYVVYPLSFKEFLRFKGVEIGQVETILYREDKRGVILSLLREYFELGGYPGIVLEQERQEKIRILRSYFDSVIVRDFAVEAGSALAEAVVKYLLSNFSGLFSVNRLNNYLRSIGFRVGKEKVLSLLKRGEESYFLFPVEIYMKSERSRQVNLKKLYIIDTGYPTALGYEFSLARAMENMVAIELKRREREIFYWKEYGKSEGQEVDFVVSKNFSAEELIQVSYSADGIREREMKALKKAEKETGARESTLLTWDTYGKQDRVRLVPIWYWLLT
jgi:predicted AAA+ superfamily ATPase